MTYRANLRIFKCKKFNRTFDLWKLLMTFVLWNFLKFLCSISTKLKPTQWLQKSKITQRVHIIVTFCYSQPQTGSINLNTQNLLNINIYKTQLFIKSCHFFIHKACPTMNFEKTDQATKYKNFHRKHLVRVRFFVHFLQSLVFISVHKIVKANGSVPSTRVLVHIK